MVTSTDNQTVISTKSEHLTAQPSFKRWLKHSFYLKTSKRFFSAEEQAQIAQAIAQAEKGHRGEIQVIVEASLPSDTAYQYDTLQRAQYLFGKYRVWDTAQNSGVLIYLNLCAHKVELVADRGIDQAVSAQCWDNICQTMLLHFKQKKFTTGLCVAIDALGEILKVFYADDVHDAAGNELLNQPRLL